MTKILMLVLLTLSIQASTLGITEHLGEKVPLDLKFINEKGESVTLKKLMDGKPTMISLNYYRCAGICTPQFNDMAKMLSRLDLAENLDYKVITIGFAEDESYELAAAKKRTMMHAIQRSFVPDAWHFVVGENNSSGILADKVGFTFKKEVSPAGVVDYVHPAALIMLSPEGKITRYLNGIEQLPFDVKMALIEAGEGKVGPTIAKNLLYCFAYDPKAKTYIFKWEKIAGAVMTLIMLGFLIYLIRTSRRNDDNQQNEGDK
ncbi:MAG TPA: SCO family protein [Epsilonproteobacteria bacterium]|nr:SCO family protein [Campylobacterota bacterium]